MLTINGHFRNQTVTGVQRYALEITREFRRMGASYRWIDPPESLRSDALRQLWMQLRMPSKVGEGDLLWSPTNTGPASCRNQVVTLHDLADQIHPEWFSRRYVAWRRVILPRLLRNVRGIITISEYSRRTIVDRFPFAEEKIEVIYNGVNTEHFYRRGEEEVERVRRSLGLHRPYLVTVGSLDPRKNINRLLRAWKGLPREVREEHELVIAGASSDKFNFELDERPAETVRFLGYVDHAKLPALYCGARGFVYPSLFEGFGLPVLEAMACGVPVYTSNTTALGEIANGTALKGDPEDTDALAEGMRRLLESSSLREEYADKGLRYARRYGWDETARKTLDFLNRHHPA